MRRWILVICAITSVLPWLSAAELPADLSRRLGGHPRVYADAARWERLREQVREDDVSRRMFRVLRARADRLLDAPPMVIRDTGNFLAAPLRQCAGRIMTLAAVYRISGDARYLQRAKKEMAALAGLQDWYVHHFLGAAEGSMGLALGIDWLHSELDPADVQAWIQVLVDRVFIPALGENGEEPGWVTSHTNWNQVCNGSLGIAMLALYEHLPEIGERILRRSAANLHHAAAVYSPQGGYPEGPGYWRYGTRFHVHFVEALNSALGDSFGLAAFPGFLQTPDFVVHTAGPLGNSFNFGDNSPSPMLYEVALFWFARELRRPELVDSALKQIGRASDLIEPTAGKHEDSVFIEGSVEHHLALALLYWDPALASREGSTETHPPRVWFSGGGIQPVATMRTAWNDPEATYLAFKGGTPNNSHADMDVGTFVLEALGVRWAIDPGTQPYAWARQNGLSQHELFGTDSLTSRRWTIFRKGPEAHNILRFSGGLQSVSTQATIRPVTGPAPGVVGSFVVDLSSTYSGQVAQVERQFTLSTSGVVEIKDGWIASESAANAMAQWLTQAQVTVENQTVWLAQDGKRVRIDVVSDPKAIIHVQDVSAPRNIWDSPNPGLTRIVFFVPTPAKQPGSLRLTVTPQSGP